ncbi:MAG: fluoride efflux transporter CrcB [Paracoccaceae bacterium]
MIWTILQVSLGGALGAAARFLTGVGVMRLTGPGFPYAILTVNVVGSFLMGFLVVYLASRSISHLSPFLLTGILGGFTTFSAFSLEAFTLYERGQTTAALIYVGASVAGSIVALGLGVLAARGIYV